MTTVEDQSPEQRSALLDELQRAFDDPHMARLMTKYDGLEPVMEGTTETGSVSDRGLGSSLTPFEVTGSSGGMPSKCITMPNATTGPQD